MSADAGLPSPPTVPMAVAARLAAGSETGHIGSATTIGVEVLARDPVDRVELWSGDQLVATQEFGEVSPTPRSAIEWIPDRVGLHVLTVRVFDTTGWAATAPPVWMRVDDPDGLANPDAGAEGLAAAEPSGLMSRRASEVSAQAVSTLEPWSVGPIPTVSVDPDTCGAEVEVPAATISESVTGITIYAAAMGSSDYAPIGAVARAGGSVSFDVGGSPVVAFAEAYSDEVVFPGEPVLLEPPETCVDGEWTGDVALTDGVLTGVEPVDAGYLYASVDSGATWNRVPATDQTFVTPDVEGGALDFGGLLPALRPGERAIVEAWGWVGGDLRALGRGVWEPAEGDASSSDVTAFDGLWAPPTSDLDWVWPIRSSGDFELTGDAELRRSGVICTFPPPQRAYQPQAPTVIVVGQESTVPPTTSGGSIAPIATLPPYCTNHPFGDYSSTFRWRPTVGMYDGGLVQVSNRPIPSGPVADFPGLVFTSTVPPTQGAAVEFEVPLANIIDPPEVTATQQEPKPMSYSILDDITSAIPPPAPRTLTSDLVRDEAQFIGLEEAAALLADPAPQDDVSIILPDLPDLPDVDALYVRVVPKLGTQLLYGESNVVKIGLSDTPPVYVPAVQKAPGLILDVTMTPPVVPNSNYSRCVRVVENPFGFDNPVPAEILDTSLDPLGMVKRYQDFEDRAFIFVDGVQTYTGLVEGATVCAKHTEPEKGFLETVIDAIATAVSTVGKIYDIFVMLYDKLKNLAADLIVKLTGCEQIAQIAGVDGEDAKTACTAVATTAITVVLAASGVPPSLPSYQELVQLAKGELKAAIADGIVTAFDIDCAEFQQQCEALIEQAISVMIDEGEKAISSAAKQTVASGDGWSLHLNSSIKVIPEPVAAPPKAVFTVSVTRSAEANAAEPPESCSYTASVWGTKENYDWHNYVLGKPDSGPIEAPMLKPDTLTLDVGSLEPGETVGGTIVLDQMLPFYPPGQHPHQKGVPYKFEGQSGWAFFTGDGGSAIDLSLLGGPDCGSDRLGPISQDGSASHPYDVVPYP